MYGVYENKENPPQRHFFDASEAGFNNPNQSRNLQLFRIWQVFNNVIQRAAQDRAQCVQSVRRYGVVCLEAANCGAADVALDLKRVGRCTNPLHSLPKGSIGNQFVSPHFLFDLFTLLPIMKSKCYRQYCLSAKAERKVTKNENLFSDWASGCAGGIAGEAGEGD